MIERLGGGVKYTVVEERGASIYSCSEVAATELAAVNMIHRSAVSIGERGNGNHLVTGMQPLSNQLITTLAGKEKSVLGSLSLI